MKRIDLSTAGKVGLQEYGGRIYAEVQTKLRGVQGQRLYREMSDNDSIVGAVLYVIRTFLQQSPWQVLPAIENDPEAQDYADFIESCIGDMNHTFEDFIGECLSFYIFGWSYFEVSYKLRNGASDDPTQNSTFTDGKVGLREIALRDQLTLDHWEFDDFGQIAGMWQAPPPNGRDSTGQLLFIPRAKALHFRSESRANNPEGRSMLRNAVVPYSRKKRIEDIEVIGIERDLAGVPVLEVPQDMMAMAKADPTSDEAMNLNDSYLMVTDMRRDTREGFVVPCEMDPDTGKPSGWKLKLLTAGGSRQINIDGTVRRYDQRIAMTLLCQFIMLGTENVGSKSMHGSMSDQFTTTLKMTQQRIQAELNNRLVPDLCDLNGIPPDKRPRFQHGEVEEYDLTEVANYVAQLARAGFSVADAATERKLRAMAGLPPPEESDDMPGGPGAGPTDDEAPAGAGVAGVQNDLDGKSVAAVTLTGIQVQALLSVIDQVAQGQLPREAAKNIIALAFAVPAEQAEQMLGTVGAGFVPAAKPTPPPVGGAPFEGGNGPVATG